MILISITGSVDSSRDAELGIETYCQNQSASLNNGLSP